MAKRTSGKFPRRLNDAYDTPTDPGSGEPILKLLPHLAPGTRFIEPCVGAGALAMELERHEHHCVAAFDVKPRMKPRYAADGPNVVPLPVFKADAARFRLAAARRRGRVIDANCWISNPPWTRALLHPIILNLYFQLPFWALIDADWMHIEEAGPYVPLVRKVVSVGRVRWIPGTEHKGNDNAVWVLFAPPPAGLEFVGLR
jgi:hypothetical protein